jgi:hypothetical protein
MSRLCDAFILMFAVIGMGTVVSMIYDWITVKIKRIKERV